MKTDILKNLFDCYDDFKAKNINSDFIPHDVLKREIEAFKNNITFEIIKIGNSIEGRDIYRIKIGKGKTKILVWSQMHGDEPTATSAIFDLFNFFADTQSYNELRKLIIDDLEIHFIPMLNPDGAERFQRENSINVDINRDAVSQVCDESKLLWDYAQNLKPEFGFNLHDQNSYYTAGRTNKSSAISLLIPPMDFVKSINYTREKGMQIILKINEILSEIIPGQVARYSDDFEPRAFGDNFVKTGISSILIESGFYQGDYKKDFVRKLNFISLLTAFTSIVKRDHEKLFYADYFEIPENRESLFDLLLKNVVITKAERNFIVDVGINRKKKYDQINKKFYFESTIAGIGDLSTFYGIEEYDMENAELEKEKFLFLDSAADFELKREQSTIYKVVNGIIQRINN